MASDIQIYREMIPLGEDETPYQLLTTDYISTGQFEGQEILKVETEGLTMLADRAIRDSASSSSAGPDAPAFPASFAHAEGPPASISTRAAPPMHRGRLTDKGTTMLRFRTTRASVASTAHEHGGT